MHRKEVLFFIFFCETVQIGDMDVKHIFFFLATSLLFGLEGVSWDLSPKSNICHNKDRLYCPFSIPFMH